MRDKRTPALIATVGACLLATVLAIGPAGALGGGDGPELTGPIPASSGDGQSPPNLPKDVAEEYGYVEEEYFVSGVATSYLPVGTLGTDGRWDVAPAEEAPYVTRIKVRRPKDMDDFSGNVVVEWLNVTAGIDVDPDFGLTYPVLAGNGDVHVAMSTQAVAVNEGPGLDLGLPGSPPAEATAPLKSRDPERYADLTHPGDDYSYDIATQVGELAQAGDLTKGEKPDHVVLMGESQSAGRLAAYANAVQPIADVYDGILIHSRGAGAAAIATAAADQQPEVVQIRTDLDIPVFQYETEGDVAGTGQFVRARQPDSRRLVTWEVAGTAHADGAIADAGKRSLGVSAFDIVEVCGAAANTGPHAEALRAAYAAFRGWVIDGEQPPEAPPLETDGETLVRDADNNALGGVRTPDLDAPTASLLSVHQSENRICRLFGQTVPLSAERLEELYPTHADYVTAVKKAANAALRKGYLMKADRDAYLAEAKEADVPG
jgi:hypothetical protein